MFYWSYKDVKVVLSDEEEIALVRDLGQDPIDRIMYFTSRKLRKDFERRISRYLKNSLFTDPEAFRHKYVFRSCYGEDAQKMLPVLLDAFGRITRRATIGIYGNRPQLDEVADNIVYAKTNEIIQVTLFEKGKWFWSKPEASGYICLPATSIERLAGTVDNFYISSKTVTIKFHRDFVRISVHDMNGRIPNQLTI